MEDRCHTTVILQRAKIVGLVSILDPADIFPKPLGDNEEEYAMTPDSNTQSEGSTRSSILAGSGGGRRGASRRSFLFGTR
ncbi:hypothetical protein TWF506_000015 [Arthrobotrys conoides]|uniref:Uncharacterized protein n=1 Tax=Arthrobotrys conoides TaxID=74498 RepID=A0AAN8NKP6_9PEZI